MRGKTCISSCLVSRTFNHKFLSVAGLILLCLSGCADPPVKKSNSEVKVSGTVSLDGKPLPKGRITFIEEGKSPRREYVAGIQQGKFHSSVPPGKLRVEIISYKFLAQSPEPKQIIPAEYNKDSELSVDLKLDEPAEIDYELSSRKESN